MPADVGEIRRLVRAKGQAQGPLFKRADSPHPGLAMRANNIGDGALADVVGKKLEKFPKASKLYERVREDPAAAYANAKPKIQLGMSAVRANPQAAYNAARAKAASTFPNAKLSPVSRNALQRRIQKARDGRDNSMAGAGFRAG